MKNFTTCASFRFSKCFLFLLFLSFNARSADDNVFLGNGHSGALTVNSANTVVNSYSGLTVAAPVGQNFVSISNSTGFAVGDLVMVWQTAQSTTETTSSASAAADLSSQPAGRWELTRITSLTATKLTFSANLKFSYSSPGAQAIRVPEYTSVTVNSLATIVATPWNGTSGGIVIFLATGTVTNNGVVSANGSGYRGGIFSNDGDATTGVSDLDMLSSAAGQKGEGIQVNRYGTTYRGRGTFANAGGGGSGLRSGGGGGGSIGAGGIGGNSDLASDANRTVGGYGGGALVYDPVTRLVMGGGGGAGHGSSSSGAAGGSGGGIVFFRANALSGTGTISANGGHAQMVSTDAGSGGGAGGGVYVRVVGNAACNLISAAGGNGGSATASEIGPGGGGGGGKILFQSAGGSCSNWTVAGGNAGSQGNPDAPGGLSYGAANGGAGSTTTLTDGMTAPVVTIISPASGATTSDRPTISGTATTNSSVRVIVDATATYSVSALSDGSYSYQLTGAQALANGPHTVAIVADYQGLSSGVSEVSFTSNAALPVKIISFGIKSEQRKVDLKWTVVSEDNVGTYRVERSSNGRDFKEITRVEATAKDFSQVTYSATDISPIPGENLYRLKIVDRDGTFAYSRLISQWIDADRHAVIFPNPAVGVATLSVPNSGLSGTVSVINSAGKVVRQYKIPGGINSGQLQIERKQLPAGVYYVTIDCANGEKLSGGKIFFN